MAPAVEEEIAMDLVGDDPDVAPRAGGGHALQVRALEHAPDGVVGVAEQECARALAQRPARTCRGPPCSGPGAR